MNPRAQSLVAAAILTTSALLFGTAEFTNTMGAAATPGTDPRYVLAAALLLFFVWRFRNMMHL